MSPVLEFPDIAVDGGAAVQSAATSTPFNAHVILPESGQAVGTGWIPDPPDLRDYTPASAEIAEAIGQLGVAEPDKGPVPSKVDLRQWCSPIENQGQLGSCTANAAAGILEYFERRAFGSFLNVSRLFVYKTTRDLLGWVGDTGAYPRTTMGALALFGAPPEGYWPYTDVTQPGPGGARTFDEEPTSFVYQLAEHWEALSYFCYDPLGQNVPTQTVLNNVKTYLAAGVPSMFGFYGFGSSSSSKNPGDIPYPCSGERAQWGHAIGAFGYDDDRQIENTVCKTITKGALLIRNSWGTGWGEAGYGWLPYQYVIDRLASDFWSLLRMDWIATGQFGLPVTK